MSALRHLCPLAVLRTTVTAITFLVPLATLATLTTLVSPTTVHAQGLRYAVKGLGTLGGTESFAMALNESGQVAGYSRIPVEGDNTFHAFFYSNGTMTDIGTFGGFDSYAY